MAESTYASAEGFVQFDPKVREANGQEVTDYTIKTPGTEGILIRVTVWPELAVKGLEKGDWLAVDGKLSVSSYTDQSGAPRQTVQISASSLAFVKGVKRADRPVVNADNAANDKIPF